MHSPASLSSLLLVTASNRHQADLLFTQLDLKLIAWLEVEHGGVGRFLLRGLRIGASTISIIELLRNDWTGGISAGVAWLVFLQVERRLPPLSPEPED